MLSKSRDIKLLPLVGISCSHYKFRMRLPVSAVGGMIATRARATGHFVARAVLVLVGNGMIVPRPDSGSETVSHKQRTPLQDARDAFGRGFTIVGVVSVGTGLLMLASPLYMMQIYDRVISTGNTDTLLALTIIIAFAMFGYAALEGLRTLVAQRVGIWLDRRMAGPVLSASVARALQGGGSSAQGLRDVATVRGFVGSAAIFPLFDAPLAPLFLLVLFIVHPVLGTIALVGAVVLFSLGLANELLTRVALREASSASNQTYSSADATVRNADTIMAMAMLPALARRMEGHAETWRHLQLLAGGRSGLLTAIAKAIRLLLQSAILGGGAWLVIHGQLTAGMMIAASIMMGRALAPVEQAIGAWQGLVNAQTAWQRLAELLAVRPALGSGTRMPEPAGQLVADGVVYQPAGATAPVLKSVGFRIPAGSAVGIIGPSGAGKSSLVRCIVGSARPQRGAIRLDGADMAVWDPLDRGRHVGYLPQDVELFDGTVRENIARFEEADDAEVVAAAQLAGVHEMILALPDAYETRIGERGGRLSGGQRQRLALARAVFRMPRLIVLDEPNANMDAAGEDTLVRLVATLRKAGHTVLLVTHRPNLLSAVDQVMVIRDGQVAEFGPRSEIIARHGQPAAQPAGPTGAVPRAIRAVAAHAGE